MTFDLQKLIGALAPLSSTEAGLVKIAEAIVGEFASSDDDVRKGAEIVKQIADGVEAVDAAFHANTSAAK